MKKRRELSDLKNQADSSLLISKLTKEELLALEKIKEIILPLKEKYNLTFEDIKGFVEKEEVVLPVSIFNEKLTLLESAVKYLKEEKNFTLHKISELINRDERNIWNIYNQAKKKYSAKFLIKDAKFFVPISIFSNEK